MEEQEKAKINSQKYSLRRLSQSFCNSDTETQYRDYVLDHTIIFCRIAWGMILLMGGIFSLLDTEVFQDRASLVLLVRSLLFVVAMVVFGATFIRRFRPALEFSSALFILVLGVFGIFLLAMDDVTTSSPYFNSIFFAFAGIFSTAGLGFRYSVISMVVVVLLFEIVFVALIPLQANILVVYNFFLTGMLVIFAYIGFIVERVSRQNFVVSAQLGDSLSKVRKLSGLLPICAHCKMVRDDKGYWNQIEIYLEANSEADLSHGICPDCAAELYPDFEKRNSQSNLE